jgi:hypothetical protein
MLRAALLGSVLALACAAPGLAQNDPAAADRARADLRLAGRAPADAEQPAPTTVYRTPAPVEDGWYACRAAIDCEPEAAPERARPTRRWAVRSSGLPAEEQLAPHYPIAIIADVEAEKPRRRGPRR